MRIDKEKSIFIVDIDSNQFLFETDKLTKEDKIHISVIADNPSVFTPLSNDMTPYDIASALPAVIKEEVGIDVTPVKVDFEINIQSDYVEIPRDKQEENELYIKPDYWMEGRIDGYNVNAKVYPKPSIHGIENGRISKLTITDKDGNTIANYDRGWDVIPKEQYKDLYDKIVGSLEYKRQQLNKEKNNRNKEYER